MKNMMTLNPQSTLLRFVFWLLMAAALLVAVEAALTAHEQRSRSAQVNQFADQLQQATAQEAELSLAALQQLHQQAVALNVSVPQLDYLLLYRQWRQELSRFDLLAASAENRYLAADLSGLRQQVQQSFLDLRSACDQQLRRNEGASDPQRWAVHNLRGAVSVMMAYTLLEFSHDAERSRTFLGDAVEDFKQAIQTVDQADVAAAQQMVPRWNLELIVGGGETLAVGQGMAGSGDLEQVRGQLQAVVPNVGGYAPGVPLETRVRK